MKKGFTLIEVLVVAVIVAILAAVAIPAYNGYIMTSKERVATNTAGTVASALAAYYSDFQNSKGMLTGLAANPGADLMIPGNPLKMPEDFSVATAGSVVTVTHKDGTASGTSVWY
ncbi:MAG: prepilin-type N-terminal cleavage/methylation domain-containing protein [Candidatus Delongbacteria bacterium]|nr:prepilin-type N-terminal cleavage/methylation domain-containing protein [Candidatus Delongbacteria bacterium]